MNLLDAFLTQYGGRVLSPGIGYRWRGPLPHRAAYVLVPFRGIVDEPFTCTVELPGGNCDVAFEGMDGSGGSIAIRTENTDETIEIKHEPQSDSRL